MRTRLWGRAARSALATAVVVALAGSLTPVASAQPSLGEARARAAQLSAQVDRLEVETEQATEDYNAVQARLGALVTRSLLAQRQLEQAQSARDSGRDAAADRVRAIYMAGGQMALYSTVLDGGNVADVLARYQTVQSLVRTDSDRVDDASTVVGTAGLISRRLAGYAARQTVLEREAADAAARVRGLLARQRLLLDDATEQVRRLAAEDRRRREEAAARAAAARLSALGVATGSTSGDATRVDLDLPPGNRYATAAIRAARGVLGAPYVWGATGPRTFDCSGLTGWAYRQAGLVLPRTSRQQWYAGRHPALRALAPGDLVFWATDTSSPATIHHVGLYVGNGYVLHAPHTGDVVRVSAMWLDGYIGATRPGSARA